MTQGTILSGPCAARTPIPVVQEPNGGLLLCASEMLCASASEMLLQIARGTMHVAVAPVGSAGDGGMSWVGWPGSFGDGREGRGSDGEGGCGSQQYQDLISSFLIQSPFSLLGPTSAI